jgi:hypothetical protein
MVSSFLVFTLFFEQINTIRIFKSRRMRWVGHAVRVGRRRMHTGFGGKDRKREPLG